MTPNELADELHTEDVQYHQEGVNAWAEKAITMLRQQAQEIGVLEANCKIEKNIKNAQFQYIKELEKEVEHLKADCKIEKTIANDQFYYARKLEKDLFMLQKHYDQLCEDCTCQGGHSEAYLKAKGKL